MDLAFINLARVAAFLEIQSLDPRGRNTATESIAALAGRYHFARVPRELSEMDFQKGIVYAAGRLGNIAIEQIQLFYNGVAVDTRSSTDDSIQVLDDLIQSYNSVTGAIVAPTRRNLVSQIVFRSPLNLSLLNPILQPIADRLSESASRDLNHPITFGPIAFIIGPDATQLKAPPSTFTIERRPETAFSENTYYSTAPLSTAEHISLIENIEKALSTQA